MNAELGSVTGDASVWIGAVLPDGVTRVPAGWINRIARALDMVDPANTWRTLLDLFPPNDRRLIVLDHVGRPAQQTEFQIRFSGDTGPRWTRTLPAGVFDLEQVVAGEPLDGVPSLFTPPAGRQFELRATLGAGAIPVQSILEVEAASLGDGYLAIPPSAAASRLHLQILDLSVWYPPASTPSSIERFSPGSHLEPLVDGIPAFTRLVADLKRAGHPDHGAQFTGWAFNRFVLNKEDGRNLVEIAQDILGHQGSVRLLATKFIQDEENFDDPHDPVMGMMFVILFALGQGVLWKDLIQRTSDTRGAELTLFAPLFAGLAIDALAGRIREILHFLEPSGELITPMNALVTGGPIAIYARNPVRFRDNPAIVGGIPLDLDSDQRPRRRLAQQVAVGEVPGRRQRHDRVRCLRRRHRHQPEPR